MSRACVVFGILGPNPAPLTELAWKLARHEGYAHVEVRVVVEQRSRFYLDGEVLAPGEAWAQLQDLLGAEALPRPVVRDARDASGALITDDVEPEARDSYVAEVWSAAREAVEHAGERPVVFGLMAGRRRTMTALATSVFQLLGRPQDRLLDVRVSDPRVEGGTGFFFPDQPARWVRAKSSDELVDAAKVEVRLVELELPRLRAFVPEHALESLAEARRATESTLLEVAPPRLVVDLDALRATVDGEALPLSKSELLWYAFLCFRKLSGEDEVWTRDVPALRAFLREAQGEHWRDALPEKSVFLAVLDGDDDEEDRLSTWRSYTSRKMKRFVKPRRSALHLLLPKLHRRKLDGAMATLASLRLDRAFIQLRPSRLQPWKSPGDRPDVVP